MAEVFDSVLFTIDKLEDLPDESSIDVLNKLCYISSCFKLTFQYRYIENIKRLLLHYSSDLFLDEFHNFNGGLKLKFLQNIYHSAAYYRHEANVMAIIDGLVEQLRIKELLTDFLEFFDIYLSLKTFSDNKIQGAITPTISYYKTLSALSLNYPPIDLTYNENNICEVIIRLLKLTGFDMNYATTTITENNLLLITKIHNFILCECHYKPLYYLLKSILDGRWTVCVGPSNCGKSEILRNLAYGYFNQPQYPYFNTIPMGSHVDSSVLHGMYVCDSREPGRYVWKPGFVPQSLTLGSWLVMENWEHSNELVKSYIAPILNDIISYIPNVGYICVQNPKFHLFITKTIPNADYNLLSNGHDLGNCDLMNSFPYCEIINFTPYNIDDVARMISHLFSSLCPILSDLIEVFELTIKEHAVFYLPLKEFFRLCQCLTTLQENECTRIFSVNHNKNCATKLINSELLVKLILDFLSPYLSCNKGTSSKFDKNADGNNVELHLTFAEKVCSRFNVTIDSLNDYVMNGLARNYTSPSFFMTKPVKKAIHTIEMCVSNNFPVLLVGETGAGKTSLIQRLVDCPNRGNVALKVVNMGIQSESSDLIGGFKPFPIITQIIELFSWLLLKNIPLPKQYLIQTKQKLEQLCSSDNDFQKMKTLIHELQRRFKFLSLSAELKREFTTKINAVCSLLDKGIGVCFQFKEGVLLDCMRNGHWLLIDEINMAPADTLHVISLVLNEQLSSLLFLMDDNQHHFRVHPDFRLFGCMNPPTDVNKKTLPPTLKSFFCELYIDDHIDDEDLALIVNGYLSEFGLSSVVISKIVDIYWFFTTNAQANDITIHQHSKQLITNGIRNLCRVLKIARCNYCKNLLRSVYEAFLVVYCNTISGGCHSENSQLRSHFIELLRCSEEKLDRRKCNSPKNSSIYDRPLSCHFERKERCLQVEGFWLPKGDAVNNIDDPTLTNYLQTVSVKKNLQTICRILSFSQLPILLEGETSVGKTSLITYLSKLSNNICIRINNHDHTDIQDYIGGYTFDNGNFLFQEGPLVTAMRNGYWIILDELNLAPPDVLEMINRVLDDNRELFLPETMETVKAAPSFRLFATQNPMTSGYSGRKPLSNAFRNRFIELTFNELPKQEQIEIMAKIGRIGTQYATFLVEVMLDLRTKRKMSGIFQGKYGFVTLRDLFKIASRFDGINEQKHKSVEKFAVSSKLNRHALKSSKSQQSLVDWKLILSHITLMVLGGKCRDGDDINVVIECINKKHKNAIINLMEILSFNYVYCDLIYPSLRKSIKNIINESVRFNHLVVNNEFQKTVLLSFAALNNAEPLLLIGPSGTGKTTLCEVYAQLTNRKLYTLSCHSGTETADFIGSLYPVRNRSNNSDKEIKQQNLFEWVDGPLIEAMKCGGVFLLDEISLADDAILERLNSVLESNTRSLVVAERGMVVDDKSNHTQHTVYTVEAHPDFRIAATMNPSGDYGKKELTNALRNRFTEVYCDSYTSKDKIAEIIKFNLSDKYIPQLLAGSHFSSNEVDFVFHLLKILEDIAVNLLCCSFESFVSIRKVIFMLKFVKKQVDQLLLSSEHSSIDNNYAHYNNCGYSDNLWFIWWEAICSVFLDKYSLNLVSYDDLLKYREMLSERIVHCQMVTKSMNPTLHLNLLSSNSFYYGVYPYVFESDPDKADIILDENQFHFGSVIGSCYKIFRAITVDQPILLEGPPGSGKTSIVMNLARYAKKKIVRINLSEQTEMADLFGFDMPKFDACEGVIKFEWKNGPFLDAMQNGYWILLDEINLASQTVLEGLNACFDHRSEIYVNSLGKRFTVDHKNTKIFASQNPAELGGGRKQLPASFTDRFIRIYFNPLSEDSIYSICHHSYFSTLERAQNLKFLNRVFSLVSSFIQHKTNTASLDFCSSSNMNFKFNANSVGLTQNHVYQMKTNFRSISRWCILSKECTTTETLFYNFLLVFIFPLQHSTVRRELTEYVWKHVCSTSTSNELIEDNYDEIMRYFTVKLNRKLVSFGHFSVKRPPSTANHYISYVGFNRLQRCVASSVCAAFASICCAISNNMPIILYSSCTPPIDKLQLFEILKAFTGNNVHTIIGNSDMDIQYLVGGYEISSVNHHLTQVLFGLENFYNLVYLNGDCMYCPSLKNNQLLRLLDQCYILNGSVNQIDRSRYEGVREALGDFLEFASGFDCDLHINSLQPHFDKLIPQLEKLIDMLGYEGSSGFSWVNGHLIDCMVNGRWCVIDNANLCSLSVLDRLNSLLEPNGSLILDNFDGRKVSPHPDFRLFLLCDLSIGGELSDAMRNRCLEFYMDSLMWKNLCDSEEIICGLPLVSKLPFDLDVIAVKTLIDYSTSRLFGKNLQNYDSLVVVYEVLNCFVYNYRQFNLLNHLCFNSSIQSTCQTILNFDSNQQFLADLFSGNVYKFHLTYLCDTDRFDDLKNLSSPKKQLKNDIPIKLNINLNDKANESSDDLDYSMIDIDCTFKMLAMNFHTIMITYYPLKVCSDVAMITSQSFHSLLSIVRESYRKLEEFLSMFPSTHASIKGLEINKMLLNISFYFIWLKNMVNCLINYTDPTYDFLKIIKCQWIWYYLISANFTYATEYFVLNNSSSRQLDRSLLGGRMDELMIFLASYRFNIRLLSDDKFLYVVNYFHSFQKSIENLSNCASTVFDFSIGSDVLKQQKKPVMAGVRIFQKFLYILSNRCHERSMTVDDIGNLFSTSKLTSILVTSAALAGRLSPPFLPKSAALSHLIHCDVLNALVNAGASNDKKINPYKVENFLPHLYFTRKLNKFRQCKDSYNFLISLANQTSQLDMPLERYLSVKSDIILCIQYIDENLKVLTDWPIRVTNEIIQIVFEEINLFETFSNCLLECFRMRQCDTVSESKAFRRILNLKTELLDPAKVSLSFISGQLSSDCCENALSLGECLSDIGHYLFKVGCEWCWLLCLNSDMDIAEVQNYIKRHLNDYFDVISIRLDLFAKLEDHLNSTHVTNTLSNSQQYCHKKIPLVEFYNLILSQKNHSFYFYNDLPRNSNDHSNLYPHLQELLESISKFILEISTVDDSQIQFHSFNARLGEFVNALLDVKYRSYMDLTICLVSKLLLVRFAIQLIFWSKTISKNSSNNKLLFNNKVLPTDYLDYLTEIVNKRANDFFVDLLHLENTDKLDFAQSLTFFYLTFLNICHITKNSHFEKKHFDDYFNYLLSAFCRLRTELVKKIDQNQLAKSSLYKYEHHTYSDVDDTTDNIESRIRKFFNEKNSNDENSDDFDNMTESTCDAMLTNLSADSYSYDHLLQCCQQCISNIILYLINYKSQPVTNSLSINYFHFVHGEFLKHKEPFLLNSNVIHMRHNETYLSNTRMVLDSLLVEGNVQISSADFNKFIDQQEDMDIYHKPFPQLVLCSTVVIRSISDHTAKLLDEYPEHAALLDIAKSCRGYMSISMESPLITFVNSATRILMTLENWNSISPTNLQFSESLCHLKTLIVNWRNMQTKHWISLVDTHRSRILNSSIHSVGDIVICLDIIKNHANASNFLSMCDQLQVVVKNFIEKASLVDFQARLDCLRYFAKQFCTKIVHPNHCQLYWLFENLYYFYSQFTTAIQRYYTDSIDAPRNNIKEFVDIAKWKSFNYWSIKESTDKAHRVIYGNIKKLESIYNHSVKSFLVPNELKEVLNFVRDIIAAEKADYNSLACLPQEYHNEHFIQLLAEDNHDSEFSLFMPKVHRCIKKISINYSNLLNIEEKMQFTTSLVDEIDHLFGLECSAIKKTQKDVARFKSALLLRLLTDLKQQFSYSYRRGIALKNTQKNDDKFYSMFAPLCDKLLSGIGHTSQQLYCSIVATYISYTSAAKSSHDIHSSLIERMSGYIELLFDSIKCQRYEISKFYNSLSSLQRINEQFSNLKDLAANQLIFVLKTNITQTLMTDLNKIEIIVDYFNNLLPAFRMTYPQLETFLNDLTKLVGCISDCICLKNQFPCYILDSKGFYSIKGYLNQINTMVNNVALPLKLKITLQHILENILRVLVCSSDQTNTADAYSIDTIIRKFIVLHQNTMKISDRKDCVEYMNNCLETCGVDNLFTILSQLFESVLEGKVQLTLYDYDRIVFCITTTLQLCSTLFRQFLAAHQSHLLFCNILFVWFSDVFANGYTPTIPDDQQEKLADGDANVGGFNICENASSACQDVSNQIENQDQVEEDQKTNNGEPSTNSNNQMNDETDGIEMGEDFEDFQSELFGNGLIDEESVEDEVKGDVDESHIMDEFDEKLWQDDLNDDVTNDDGSPDKKKQRHIEDTKTVANEDNADLADGDFSMDSTLNDVNNSSFDNENSDDNMINDPCEVEMDSSCAEEPNEDHALNENKEGEDPNENDCEANTMATGVSLYDDDHQITHMENNQLHERLHNTNLCNENPLSAAQSGCGSLTLELSSMHDPASQIFESYKRTLTTAGLHEKQLADLDDEAFPVKKANIVDRVDDENDLTSSLPTNSVTHTDLNDKYDSLAADIAERHDQQQSPSVDGILPSLTVDLTNEGEYSEIKGEKYDNTIFNEAITSSNDTNNQEANPTVSCDRHVEKYENDDSWFKLNVTDVTNVIASTSLTSKILALQSSRDFDWANLSQNEVGMFMSKWLHYLKSVEKYSHELCEQLRTIIQPTQSKKLGGSYRTGKKLNMRKVITYLASQFTKDRIWMRRIKPTQRTYQIMLAIDDSTSMQDNQSKDMAFESLAMLTSAFNLSDIGHVGLCSYGECTRQLIDFNQKYLPTSPFYASVMGQLTFAQNKTNISTLLKHCAVEFSHQHSATQNSVLSDCLPTQLLIILSDGRGIFSEGTKVVHDSIDQLKNLGVFILYVILDNPHTNKEPIDKIQVPLFKDGKLLHIKSYMEEFPFAHYIVLRKITALPHVLAQAVRQWVEVVTLNSG